jgi:hypothetical protein
LSEKIKTIFL